MVSDDVFLFLSALVVRFSPSAIVEFVPVYLGVVTALLRFCLRSFSLSNAVIFVDKVSVVSIGVDDLRALKVIKIAALLLYASFITGYPRVPSTDVATRLAAVRSRR